MALTNEQLVELRGKLTKKLIENSLSNLTWDNIALGISLLSEDDKQAITNSLANNSSLNLSTFINSRLSMYLGASVEVEVTAIINSGSVSLDLLYIMLK